MEQVLRLHPFQDPPPRSQHILRIQQPRKIKISVLRHPRAQRIPITQQIPGTFQQPKA